MANGKAEVSLEHLVFTRRQLETLYGLAGVDPEIAHANLEWLTAAITEAKREDKLHGWRMATEGLPTMEPVRFVEVLRGADSVYKRPSVSLMTTQEYALEVHGTPSYRDSYWREIGPLPEMK